MNYLDQTERKFLFNYIKMIIKYSEILHHVDGTSTAAIKFILLQMLS